MERELRPKFMEYVLRLCCGERRIGNFETVQEAIDRMPSFRKNVKAVDWDTGSILKGHVVHR